MSQADCWIVRTPLPVMEVGEEELGLELHASHELQVESTYDQLTHLLALLELFQVYSDVLVVNARGLSLPDDQELAKRFIHHLNALTNLNLVGQRIPEAGAIVVNFPLSQAPPLLSLLGH